MEKIDTAVRHVTQQGTNLFDELGFPAAESQRLQASLREQIDETRSLMEQSRDGSINGVIE